MSIICCIVRDLILKVAKFLNVRDKALSDAFLCIATLLLPTHSSLRWHHPSLDISLFWLGVGFLCISTTGHVPYTNCLFCERLP